MHLFDDDDDDDDDDVIVGLFVFAHCCTVNFL